MDNRFDYLNNMSIEELEKEKEAVEQDIEYNEKTIKSQKNGELTSELYKDNKYDKEKLEYIEELLSIKKSK